MINKKNVIKEKEENEILLITKVAICFGIIYGIYKFCKIKEEKEDLENQIKTQEMIIEEKTNQLGSIISKMKLAENPSSWQKNKESSKEIWEGSKITKKIIWKTRDTFDSKNQNLY